MFKKNKRSNFSEGAAGKSYSPDTAKESSAVTDYFQVGTVTAALSLIIFGSALIIYFIHPYDSAKMIYLFPVVLCLLGIEMLVYRLIAPKNLLRFDKRAFIFAALIILLAALFTSGKAAHERKAIEEEYYKMQKVVDSQIYNEIYNRIEEASPVSQLDVSSYYSTDSSSKKGISIEEYREGMRLNLRFDLQNQDNPHDFAQKIMEVIQLTDIQQYQNIYVTMSCDSTQKKGLGYTIRFSDRFALKSSAEDIEKSIEINDYSEYYEN